MRSTFLAMLQAWGFNSISRVRANSNGYLFITMVSTDNIGEAENIYFGRRASAAFSVGQMVDPSTLFCVETTNANGDVRWKLTDTEGDAVATLEAKGYQMLNFDGKVNCGIPVSIVTPGRTRRVVVDEQNNTAPVNDGIDVPAVEVAEEATV